MALESRPPRRAARRRVSRRGWPVHHRSIAYRLMGGESGV